MMGDKKNQLLKVKDVHYDVIMTSHAELNQEK